MGHARALLGFEGERAILEGLERVIRDEFSVRQTERLAKGGLPSALVPPPATKVEVKPPSTKAQPPWAKGLEDRIRHALGVRVRIQDRGGYRGQIVLDYGDRDSLERVVDLLAPREDI